MEIARYDGRNPVVPSELRSMEYRQTALAAKEVRDHFMSSVNKSINESHC